MGVTQLDSDEEFEELMQLEEDSEASAFTNLSLRRPGSIFLGLTLLALPFQLMPPPS
jgi:hypothetical protein